MCACVPGFSGEGCKYITISTLFVCTLWEEYRQLENYDWTTSDPTKEVMNRLFKKECRDVPLLKRCSHEAASKRALQRYLCAVISYLFFCSFCHPKNVYTIKTKIPDKKITHMHTPANRHRCERTPHLLRCDRSTRAKQRWDTKFLAKKHLYLTLSIQGKRERKKE